MNVGAEFIRARRLLGLSIGEISALTEISAETVSAIEENRVDELPVVDVDGALRAYAAAVGLDPDDLSERYFAQFDLEPRVDVLPDSTWDIDAFPSEATLAPTPPTPPPILSSTAENTDPASAALAPTPTQELRPIAPDDRIPPPERREIPGPRAGMAVVAMLGVACGFLLAEYSHRWEPAAGPTLEARRSIVQEQPQSAAGPRSNKPQEHLTARDGDTTDASAPTPEGDRTAWTGGAPRVESRDLDEATTIARAHATAPMPNADRASPDLSGWWSVTNRVESTLYAPFEHLNLGYRVKLTQKDDQISGTGHKWMENGRQVPPAQRTTIAVKGVVQQGRVTLWFTEYGRRRTSTGRFAYAMSDMGVLEGSFTSDAAQSSGSSRASRIQGRE